MRSAGLFQVVLIALCLVWTWSPAFGASTELISVSTAGQKANDFCGGPDASDDGRFVVFFSGADNLAPGDTNGFYDIFLRDRQTRETTCISVGFDGSQANGNSFSPLISSWGDFVVFTSAASNLVPGDTNDRFDVFLWNRATDSISRLSLTSTGGEADGDSGAGFLSFGDRYLAFSSQAGNMVPDDTNLVGDAFVLDLQTGGIERVSIAADGTQGDRNTSGGVISTNGSVVAFTSDAQNLIPDDTNFRPDVFVREHGETSRVSVSSDGAQADDRSFAVDMTADGRYVLFASAATNLVALPTGYGENFYMRDLQASVTSLVSVGSDGLPGEFTCVDGANSADGRYVVFSSESDGLVPDDDNFEADVFIRDLVAQRTVLISRAGDGSLGHDGGASDVSITPDGRYIAFSSRAQGLAPDDTGYMDYVSIYLRDRLSFEDVPLDHWAFYEVGACNMAGIAHGYPDGLYRPEVTITRDQMAVYVARALSGSTVPTGPAEATFPDVPTDHWAYNEIEYAVANNVVEGYADGNYQPEWDLTRAEMAVFIARSVVAPTGEDGLVGYKPPDTPSFPDVPTTYWSYKHIEYCKERGIVAGYPDGTYGATWRVTRDQMAVYVQRAFQLPM